MQWGVGLSRLWYETDSVAVIPTFEMLGYSVLDGRRFIAADTPTPVDTETIFNVAPGARFVLDNGGDLGLLEFGLSSSIALTDHRWHSMLVRLETRLSW